MIYIKLKEFADKKGKTITDIAKETGLNRNTVAALYHGKVDGIRFDTIESIMRAYKLGIVDLIGERRHQKTKKERRYKQEAAMVPFYAWPAFLAFADMPKEYFNSSFENGSIYYKDDYAVGYWDYWAMNSIATFVYKTRPDEKRLEELYELYLSRAKNLENVYFHVSRETILSMNKEELMIFFNDFQSIYKKFWQYGMFVDAFDIGFDFEKIAEISTRYGFSKKEAEILTTPHEMTFNNERELELLKIAKKIKKRGNFRKADIKKIIKNDQMIKSYKERFDYYKSNYANVEHITDAEVEKDILRWIENPKELEKNLRKLDNMSQVQIKKIKKVLVRHDLKENPLYFFSKLTYWREHRKMVNLMGFHVLERILIAIEKETGISLESLRYLTFGEVEIALAGLVSGKVLKRRKEKGFFVDITNKGLKMIEGKQAMSLKEEMEQKLHKKGGDDSVIFGRTASQGYARGKAKVILHQKDFHKMQEGDILVTGMTRPEFVPLMRRAGGIVTNEGGVTCHAAIVSRELGKPCVIGTGNATEMIKDGDIVEVRANHGTVRVLK